MTVLVTGAAGFLGINMVRRLANDGHRVVGLDTTTLSQSVRSAAFGDLPDVVEVRGDICRPGDLADAISRYRVTRVVHLGAVTVARDEGPARTRTAVRVNVVGTQNVLAACAQHRVLRCVIASSSAVYGDTVFGPAPVTEEAPATPQSLYGVTKLAAEELAAAALLRDGVDAVVARVTALFGPWERPTGSRSLPSPLWQMLAMADAGTRVTVAGGGHRDWTYVEDAAAALATLLTAARPRHRVYNVGCGVVWSPAVLAELLKASQPGFDFAVAECETNLNYGDDLTRTRQPLDSGRLRTEYGIAFASPESACRRYHLWWQQYRHHVSQPLAGGGGTAV